MDSTYCIGGATHDVFDQYPYKGSSFDLSLNIPEASHSNRFMGDQGFHTPNIGDEEFDIHPITLSSNPSPGHYDRPQEVMIDNASQSQAHYQNQFMASMTQHHQPRSSPEYTSPQSVSNDTGVSPNGMYMPMTTAHTMVPPHSMAALQQQQPYSSPGLINRTSPANSSSGSPSGAHELGSEDSNDEQTGGTKRPSPEPVEAKATTASKKPKVPKKKKKRDPNEPQKPVSAYALFFRDTQAAIKGQNPNATFGEVSKIVASMWDALDAENKNVYKKKTEAAKKEYLKALAAYRASLVSKGTTEQEGLYSGYSNYSNYSNYSVPPTSMPGGHQMSSMAKKSPLLTSLMNENGTGNQSVQETGMLGNPMMASPGAMMRSPQGYLPQSQSPQYHSPQSLYQQQQQMMMSQQGHISQPYQTEAQSHHMTMQQLSPQQTLLGQGSPNQYSSPHHPIYHQQHPSLMMQQPPSAVSTSQQQSPPPQHPMMSPQHQQHPGSPGNDVVTNSVCPSGGGSGGGGSNGGCIRAGCTNPAIHHPDWEDEYCSSECVVSHCRDVFNAWVASNQSPAQNYSSTSVK